MLAYCDHAPEAGRAEIERLIDTYPSQRWQALLAKTTLVARDAAKLADLSQLPATLSRLLQGNKGFLQQIPKLLVLAAPIAERQTQLDQAVYPTVRKRLSELLLADIESFRDQVAGFSEPIRSEFR